MAVYVLPSDLNHLTEFIEKGVCWDSGPLNRKGERTQRPLEPPCYIQKSLLSPNFAFELFFPNKKGKGRFLGCTFLLASSCDKHCSCNDYDDCSYADGNISHCWRITCRRRRSDAWRRGSWNGCNWRNGWYRSQR